MINTYSAALDRRAWCPKLDFHLLQDLTLIICLANLIICFSIYINIVAFPIYAVGEENKERGYRFPTEKEWVDQEIVHYNFIYTLFDVIILLMCKMIVTMSIWATGPYTSQASTISWLQNIPVGFQVFVLILLFFKMVLFDYQKYIPDLDNRGADNYNDAENVADWTEKDGEVVAEQDRSHNNAKSSTISMMIISFTLTIIELICQVDANRRERKYKRFLVHPDRCPICTQPIGTCPHQQQFGLDVVRNWHYGFCDCLSSQAVCLKLFLCCCCGCYEGDLGAAYDDANCCWKGCTYCLSCMLCCPFGVHACIGCWTRKAIRKRNGIVGTMVRDFFSHWCCCCCALIQEKRQLHADNFVKNEYKERATEAELAAQQLKVTAPPKIAFGMFQGDIVGHRRRDGVLEYRVHWEGKPRAEDDWFIRNQLVEEFPDVVVEYERLNGI